MSTIWRHTVFGVFFGFLFPVVSLALDAWVVRPAPASLPQVMKDNPIHFIVALAPPVLGGVFYLVGRARWQLEERMKALERARAAAQSADRAKSEFLATMSHELRTPMNGVLGMAELLAGTALDARQRGFVETIGASGQALLGVINDILDVSKIEAGFMSLREEPFRLRSLAQEPGKLLAPMARKKGIELLARVDPALPRLAVGDPLRLRQVVTNLAANAVKFTEAGQVEIDVSREPAHDGSLRVRVEVRDTGCGIPADRLEGVFDKFTQVDGSYTRRQEGTGLGLAISKGLVELMGGEIGARSEPGRGSTFWFVVPLAEAPADAGATPPFALVEIAGRRALVVDDNASNRMILAELLEAWRIEEEAAPGGAEALRRLRAAARCGRPFDLVLLDHHMPGMSGADVLAELRADPAIAGTSVVLLSSMDADLDRAGLGAARPDAVLTKPVGASELFDALATVTAHRASVSPSIEAPSSPSDQDRAAAAVVALPGPKLAATRRYEAQVLVVEDNRTNLLLVKTILKGMGIEPAVARDGAEAVERFRIDRPTLVLMDVSMPVMNGHDATRAIRAIEEEAGWPPCCIVGLTAHALEGDRQACLAVGMDDHLPKPIPIAALKRRVAEALAPSAIELEWQTRAHGVPFGS